MNVKLKKGETLKLRPESKTELATIVGALMMGRYHANARVQEAKALLAMTASYAHRYAKMAP